MLIPPCISISNRYCLNCLNYKAQYYSLQDVSFKSKYIIQKTKTPLSLGILLLSLNMIHRRYSLTRWIHTDSSLNNHYNIDICIDYTYSTFVKIRHSFSFLFLTSIRHSLTSRLLMLEIVCEGVRIYICHAYWNSMEVNRKNKW